MNWGELKKSCIGKMFGSKNGNIDSERKNNRDYSIMMPQAANEGLAYISAYRRPRKLAEFDVPDEPGKKHAVPIEMVAQDYYSPGAWEMYLIDEDDIPTPIDGITMMAGRLVFPAGVNGTINWYYDADYPTIPANAKDDYYLDIDADVLAILPLYMASQIYADDDRVQAQIWWNEFESQLAVLQPASGGSMNGEFYSISGW